MHNTKMNTQPKIAIVVPTIREHSILQFIEEWKIEPSNDYTLFVVEDNPKKTFKIPTEWGIRHFSHEDIENEFPHPEIIGRKTDAVRVFGFWKAWKQGYDYILTLDDDCYPGTSSSTMEDLIRLHLEVFKPVVNTGLFATLKDGYARGTPSFTKEKSIVKLSVGGWSKIPDIDGKTQLMIESENLRLPSIDFESKVVPYGQYYTMCGMNIFFPIEMVKYMYYFPTLDMYHRWADIWLGFCVKKLCDINNWAIVNNGHAYVRHSRASNAQKNFELESKNDGYETNDTFAHWMKELSYIGPEISQWSEAYPHIKTHFDVLIKQLQINKYCGDGFNEVQIQYFNKIADYYRNWHDVFEVKNA